MDETVRIEALRNDIARLKIFLAHVNNKRTNQLIVNTLHGRGGEPYTHGEAWSRKPAPHNAGRYAKRGDHGVPIVNYPKKLPAEV